MKYHLLWLPLALVFGACQPESPLSANPNLKAIVGPGTTSNSSWAQCTICHQVDSLSPTHSKHLFEHQLSLDVATGTMLNGAVSCLDCHFNSTQYHDSVDADGQTHHYLPILQSGLKYDTVAYSRSMDLDQLTSFIQGYYDPKAFPSDSGKSHFPAQAVRGSHNDGKVDLVFAPNIVANDSLIAHGSNSPWNPTQFTCEAMKCHSGYLRKDNTGGLYQWKRPIIGERDD